MTDFTTLDYLAQGNPKQISAYTTLTAHKVMEILHDFDPILVGTIPIDIDVETSDLDIICFWQDQNLFDHTVIQSFSRYKAFKLRNFVMDEVMTTLAHCWIGDFEIEIFGQHIPTKDQLGYRHMLVEHALLTEMGEGFRSAVLDLKRQGMKTEPAFAKVLGLEGDPYQALLRFERNG